MHQRDARDLFREPFEAVGAKVEVLVTDRHQKTIEAPRAESILDLREWSEHRSKRGGRAFIPEIVEESHDRVLPVADGVTGEQLPQILRSDENETFLGQERLVTSFTENKGRRLVSR
jgi:hypothetical protein